MNHHLSTVQTSILTVACYSHKHLFVYLNYKIAVICGQLYYSQIIVLNVLLFLKEYCDRFKSAKSCRNRDGAKSVALFATLEQYDFLYLSGISIAILKPEVRTKLIEFLAQFKAKGGKLIFDGNYRPNLWQSTEEAMNCYKALYSLTDIALPTLEDEQILFGYKNAQEALDAIVAFGATEIVLKMGEDGCLYSSDEKLGFVKTKKVSVVDTTSAGDSFNAGYLATRLKGMSVVESCEAGHILASTVIQHRGAVIPKSEMPATDLCEKVVEGCSDDVAKALTCDSLN